MAGNGTNRVEKAAFLGLVNMWKENKPSPRLDGSTLLRPPKCLKNPFMVSLTPHSPYERTGSPGSLVLREWHDLLPC